MPNPETFPVPVPDPDRVRVPVPVPVSVPDPVPVVPGTVRERRSEAGLATAELLGNAALGIAALVAIWAVLQSVGLDVMQWIRAQLLV